MEAGFHAHLAKPPPLDELNELLAREPWGDVPVVAEFRPHLLAAIAAAVW